MVADSSRRTFSFLSKAFRLTPCLGLCACVTGGNPVTGDIDWTPVDEAQELELGRQAHPQILAQFGYYEDPVLQEYVAEVGASLVPHTHRPHLDYQFTVLDHEVVNAMATPGYVYISRGLLAMMKSEAELAGVLGHELAHITARHTARQIGQAKMAELLAKIVGRTTHSNLAEQAAGVLGVLHVRGYGREAELEADRLGAQYAAMAGYEAKALLEVLHILKAHEAYVIRRAKESGKSVPTYHGLFATHPDSDERLKEVIAAADVHNKNATPLIRKETFLRHIDGMVLGKSEHQGIVRGRHFYHGPLNFTLSFPAGWEILNETQQLRAQSPDGSASLRYTLIQRKQGQQACSFLGQQYERSSTPKPFSSEGYSGCQAQVQFKGELVTATVIEHSRDIFMLAVAQPPFAQSVRYGAAMLESVQSARPMSAAEQPKGKAPRLKIGTAASGDTYGAYAAGADWDPDPENRLRLLNGAYPLGEPVVGESVKTVTP